MPTGSPIRMRLTKTQREKLATLGQRYLKSADPTVNDDSGEGYGVWDKWLNETSGEAYVCTDATEGAAVWQNISLDTEDLASMFDAKADKDTDAVVGNLYQAIAGGGYEDSGIAPADKADVTEVNALINPRQISQAINMTAAASGSNGIKVLNDDNINFGTGDFAIPIGLLLPDYTPASNVTLYHKHDGSNGIIILLLTTGVIRITINAANYDSTVAVSADDNTATVLTVSVAREIAAAAGEVLFFENNSQLGAVIAITAGVPTTVDNTSDLYVIGTSATRTAATLFFCNPYNRALSAEDVAYLYKNGIHPADMWGSQTSLITGDDSDFDTVGNWSGVDATLTGGYDSGDVGHTTTLRIESDEGANDRAELNNSAFLEQMVVGKNYRLSFDYKVISGVKCEIKISTVDFDNQSLLSASWANVNIEFTASSATQIIRFYSSGTNGAASDELLVDNVTLLEIGATAAYLPENIQPVPGQWLDASSNKLHALMPAAGCTLMRPENEFEIRWTNTWAGTSEMQYIGGTNQAVLPEGNIRIEYITLTCTTTGVSITIGDGSDADRFVTSTALADYLDISSPTKRNHDGTNRDMTITPSGAYTGSIATTVVGKILG